MIQKDLKVTVQGRIRLGTELNLIRGIRAAGPPKGDVVRVNPPEWINVRRPPAPPTRSGMDVDQDRIEYSFESTPNSVSLADQGLCQSYGIFGNPGVGKTYLLMYLLRQIARHAADDPDRKFGALILDPKAALQGDVHEAVCKAGRESDLVIINESLMKQAGHELNIIDCFLTPLDLGKCLSMAAQAAGIRARDEYWMNQLSVMLSAGLQLLYLMRNLNKRQPTIRDLAELLLAEDDVGSQGKPEFESRLDIILKDAFQHASSMTPDDREELSLCRSELQRMRPSKDYTTLLSFVDQAFGLFRRREYAMFSKNTTPDKMGRNLYDSIVEDGKIVLVSVSKRSLAISKMLCTLIKTIFQQTVLTRLDRYQAGELKNFARPILFMADEYSDVATEIPGQPMGDARFFSQMRQFGCMALVATQSVQMLKAAGLEETWKAIYGNMAAKIFMQTGDTETAEEATKLVGESEFRFRSFNHTWSPDGSSHSVNADLKDRKDLPTKIMLQTLGQGQAVVVGTTDGTKSHPGTWFVQIDPPPPKT
jgi:hypothetical protein